MLKCTQSNGLTKGREVKNKRLIIFLSIFVFLAVIVVLSSTVFSLKTVSVQLAQVDSAEINNLDESQEIENPEQII